jgi:transcriptional regulator with XRE-family HTH domain
MPRGRKASGRPARKRSPNAIDIHVGGRIRLRRTLLGMSQEKLGDALGLSFQQVQKYERGANRVGSSRLFDMARVLDVTVSYFFDEMSASTSARSPARLSGMAERWLRLPRARSHPKEERPHPIGQGRPSGDCLRGYFRATVASLRSAKQVFSSFFFSAATASV